METPTIVALDIGTSKICALVAQIESAENIRILGYGIEPSQGIRKGSVVDLNAAAQAVRRAVDKAERSSGLEIQAALVALAGANVSSVNSKGVVGVSGGAIDQNDIARAVDAARAVAVPHNREIIHVIQRGFTIDGQEGIRSPLGMHGYRLEVETHIITAAAAGVENLRQTLAACNLHASQFVLNPLAAGEVILTEGERQLGALVCDLGAGANSIAIYIDGDIWHTSILPIGAAHITADIAHGLRLPLTQAEEIKLQHGHALQSEIDPNETFTIRPFGEEQDVQINRRELAYIIEARAEEILTLIIQEIKRSGYDGLLPAGLILTGGGSQLPGLKHLAQNLTGLPVRLAGPQTLINNSALTGMTDSLASPAYSVAIGLLRWATLMNELAPVNPRQNRRPGVFTGSHTAAAGAPGSPPTGSDFLQTLKNFLRSLIP